MTVKIEISDLGNTSKGDLVKVAKFMLEFAGYSEPAPVAAPVAAPVQHVWPEDVAPTAAFAPDPVTVVAPVPPAPQAPGIEVDAQGMPWDNRIHSGSRAKVADGSWRQKRNLDSNLLAQVEGELRATMGLPAQEPVSAPAPAPVSPAGAFAPAAPEQIAPPPPPAAVVPVPPPFVANAAPSVDPAAITPPPPTPPAGVATTASPSSQSGAGVAVVTFPALMQKITQAFTAKTLDQATIQGACQQVGLPSLPMLASRPDLVGQVATILGIAL